MLAFKSGTKTKKKKRKTIADMTPEQIEKARNQRLEWYRNNKEKVREYVKDKYNNDYEFWKKITDYQREKYRSSRVNIINKKPGRKPRSSSSNSGDETSSTIPSVRRGRPRIKPIIENKEIKKAGRPIKRKSFTNPIV